MNKNLLLLLFIGIFSANRLHAQPPQVIANFTFSAASGSYFAPAQIQFIDLSSSTFPIITWHWDFGDGTSLTSNNQNPIHIYSFPGVYAVRLSVQNALGNSDTLIRMIQIGMLQQINLCPGDTSKLFSTDTASNIQWQVSTDSLNFVNISDGIYYGGTNNDTLILYSLPSNFYGNLYRCIANGQIKFETWVVQFTNSWTGAVSNAWENPANWSCGSIPDSGTDVIINSGTVVLNTNTTIRSLMLAPGASLTVATGVVLTILH